jgi:molybdate-binding protein
MKNSSIEISDQEYLIKLSKEDFDLTFIKNLLKRIKEEQYFSSLNSSYELEDLKFSQLNYESSSRFDSLRDK